PGRSTPSAGTHARVPHIGPTRAGAASPSCSSARGGSGSSACSLGSVSARATPRAFLYTRARARVKTLALLAGLLAATPLHAAPPAGTPIDNPATGTLTFAGGPLTQPSN